VAFTGYSALGMTPGEAAAQAGRSPASPGPVTRWITCTGMVTGAPMTSIGGSARLWSHWPHLDAMPLRPGHHTGHGGRRAAVEGDVRSHLVETSGGVAAPGRKCPKG
jgi:hypothetical protein